MDEGDPVTPASDPRLVVDQLDPLTSQVRERIVE